MLTIPSEYMEKCGNPGSVASLDYGEKSLLLYTPVRPADRIRYLIHGGGRYQHSVF